MMEFCVGSYLILAILGVLFWWGAFGVAKHADDIDQRRAYRMGKKAKERMLEIIPKP